MNRKLTKLWGVGLVVVLLVSMLAIAAPASADTLKWSAIKAPGGGSQIKVSDASFIRVAADGTIFVVDTTPAAADVIYKSTNGGLTWTASTATTIDVADMELSPDYVNDNTLFVLDAAAGAQVLISTNNGAKFNVLGGATAAGELGTSLAISPLYSGGTGEIMVGTVDAAVGYGNVYMWGRQGVLNWVAQALAEDITSVAFSPNYPIDATVLAIGSIDATGTRLHCKVSNAAWDAAWGPTVVNLAEEVGDAGGNDILRSDMAVVSDYNGSIPTQRRVYVSTVSNLVDNVYRVTNVTAGIALNPTAMADDEFTSLAYSGDYTTGSLFCGIDGNNAGGAAANVYRCANPTSTNPLWYAAKNPPSGTTAAAGPITYLALDPDFASNNTLWAGTVGAESAVSESIDGGVNFMQKGLIHTTLNSIQDVAVASATEFYLATEDGVGGAGIDSLWHTTNAKDWVRIFNAGFANAPRVVLSPNYASDQTAYFYENAGTAVRLSTDGGASFVNRIAPGAIADLLPIDEFTVFCGTTTNVQKSSNGGWTWAGPKNTGATVFSLAYDAGTSHMMAGATNGSIRVSKDGGSTWKGEGGPGIAGGTAVLTAFDPSYADNSFIYAVDTAVAPVAGVWRLELAPGKAWTQIDATITCAVPRGMVFDADGVLYVADGFAGAGMTRSLDPRKPDGGPVNGTWEAVGAGDGLVATYTLASLAITGGSNLLVAAETSGGDQLVVFSDTLTQVTPVQTTADGVTSNEGAGVMTIVWDRVSGAKQYQYEYDTRSDFKSSTKGTVNDPVSSFRIANLREGMQYYWRVRANTPVIGPDSGARSFFTQITTAAVAPAILSPSRGGTGPGGYDAPLQPVFQWSSFKWATGYEFQLAKDPNFNDLVVDKSGTDALGLTTVYQTVTKLDFNKTYYWRVRALGPSTNSDWSAVNGFNTMAEPVEPPPPIEIKEVPAPIINIPPAPSPPPEIVIPPAPAQPAPITPAYIWGIIIIGAVLVICLIVFIFRARSPRV